MSTTEYWYRLENTVYAPTLDEFDRPNRDRSMTIHVRRFKVISRTPKSVLIDEGFGSYRRVYRDARKRYACPTIAEAVDSFVARKARQESILKHRASIAQKAITAVDANKDRLLEGIDVSVFLQC
jgi:hypothetical protein